MLSDLLPAGEDDRNQRPASSKLRLIDDAFDDMDYPAAGKNIISCQLYIPGKRMSGYSFTGYRQ